MYDEDAMETVKQALRGLRVPATGSEYDLHAMIARALAEAGLDAGHEVPIAPRCRIDFLVRGVGVEIKQGKHAAKALHEQAARYLASPKIDSLLLVTTRGAMLPGQIHGKRVEVFGLGRLWGLALP